MSESLHRIIAFALLVLAALGCYWLVDTVWLGRYLHYTEAVEQLQDRLQRYTGLAATRPRLETEIQKIRQDNSVDNYYLMQESPTLAATDLQQQVKGIIESNGGRLASTQILPVADEGPLTKVTIRVQITVTEMEAMQKTLHALESARPLVFVDNVQVRARTVRKRVPRTRNRRDRRNLRNRNQPQPITTETQLTMQFELAGYMRKGEA
jgi:general secretion pathway protein M